MPALRQRTPQSYRNIVSIVSIKNVMSLFTYPEVQNIEV